MSIDTRFITETAVVADKTMSFEVGRFADQATAAVVGRLGDSMVLATVVGGATRDDIDWFPLQVEVLEKLYAGGKIKGSRWVKREGRPSDQIILTSRVIDRSIRPLFKDGYKGEVQVVVSPLSVDRENPIDVLALSTVSAALAISGLPWEGPLGGLRVGQIDGNFVAFPTFAQRETSTMDLIVSSTREAIVMVEAGMNEVTEDVVVSALDFAKQTNLVIIEAIDRLVAKVAKPMMEVPAAVVLAPEVLDFIEGKAQPIIDELLRSEKAGKINKGALEPLIEETQAQFENVKKSDIKNVLDAMLKKQARAKIITSKIRLDGRKIDEIRPLSAEVGVLPRVHGSAVFKRGETQVLNIATLGSPRDGQMIELMEEDYEKRYMHHYNMPPFSVGETGRVGFPSRREIGHGALAERALIPVLPSEDDFPYVLRLVSEAVSSNGSTSMASVCGSTLSLMDAGVPIKKPVAGIAMGLMVLDEQRGIRENEYVVLTDIQGLEDHIGDMDFKVAGTLDGITALQMDIKVKGITTAVLAQALAQAKVARVQIMGVLTNAIDKPRATVSEYAPKMTVLHIKPEQIGEVIGTGGKIIKAIIEDTGADINIDDSGRVVITAIDLGAIKKAVDAIEGITRELVVGEEFENAIVKSIVDFGAFVEFLPGREGLVHVSEMAFGFVKDPRDVASVGQQVKVKIIGIDSMNGKIKLSMKFGEAPEGTENRGPRQDDRGSRERRPFARSRDFRRD